MSGLRRLAVTRWRTAPVTLVAGRLLLGSGCKTSDDAAAAATQLTATASELTTYYSTLVTLLTETDQVYQIRAAVNPDTPYDEQDKKHIADEIAEIQLREKLAAALTGMAQEFVKLSGSTASTDASTAAGGLESAVVGLKIPGVSVGDTAVDVMKKAVALLVQAIQARDEHKAAQAIDQFTTSLDSWFKSEEPVCNSIGLEYANLTASLARTLITRGQVDASSYLSPAFSPYGLTPQLTDPTLRGKMEIILVDQVDQKSKAMTVAQKRATDDMEKALAEMTSRIHLVATDKPMQIRVPPITLAAIQGWASAATSNK